MSLRVALSLLLAVVAACRQPAPAEVTPAPDRSVACGFLRKVQATPYHVVVEAIAPGCFQWVRTAPWRDYRGQNQTRVLERGQTAEARGNAENGERVSIRCACD